MQRRFIYAKYSDIASDVVLVKQTKLILVGQRNISYDARASKGKQIAKENLQTHLIMKFK